MKRGVQLKMNHDENLYEDVLTIQENYGYKSNIILTDNKELMNFLKEHDKESYATINRYFINDAEQNNQVEKKDYLIQNEEIQTEVFTVKSLFQSDVRGIDLPSFEDLGIQSDNVLVFKDKQIHELPVDEIKVKDILVNRIFNVNHPYESLDEYVNTNSELYAANKHVIEPKNLIIKDENGVYVQTGIVQSIERTEKSTLEIKSKNLIAELKVDSQVAEKEQVIYSEKFVSISELSGLKKNQLLELEKRVDSNIESNLAEKNLHSTDELTFVDSVMIDEEENTIVYARDTKNKVHSFGVGVLDDSISKEFKNAVNLEGLKQGDKFTLGQLLKTNVDYVDKAFTEMQNTKEHAKKAKEPELER